MATNIKKEFGNTRNRKPDISTLVYGKVPPQAPELEEAVLGAIMLQPHALDEVMSICHSSEVFYGPANQKIYSAMLELSKSGYPVDLLTVTEQLRKSSDLELVGGPYYLTKLTANVVTGAHIEPHCRIIVEKYMQREAIRICGETIGQAYEDVTDAFDLIDSVQGQFETVTDHINSHATRKASDVMIDTLMEIEEERMSVSEPGVYVGLKPLRDIIQYFRSPDVVIIAARPGTGKTALILDLAVKAAMYEPNPSPVGIISMEMKDTQLMKRMLSNLSGIPLHKITNPKSLTQPEYDVLQRAYNRYKELQVYIDQQAGLNIHELKAKARKMKRKYGVKMLMVDYLQLMEGDTGDLRKDFVKITRSIKKLAKELDMPIILLSQLNRELEKRANKKPILSDLKESGSIEEDADMVIFLSLPTEDEVKQNPQMKDMVVIDVAKFRNGRPDVCTACFDREYQRFSEETPFNRPEETGTSYQTDYKSKAAGEKEGLDAPF